MATEAQPSFTRRRAIGSTLTSKRLAAGVVTLVVAYLGVLAWQLQSVVNVASWNADNANMLNLAGDLGSLRGDEVINMGNAPLFSTLWFNHLLNGFTSSSGLLQVMPLVWYAIGASMVVFTVVYATDRLTGGATAALLLCLNPATLDLVTSFATHGTTWFTTASLSAYAVFVGAGARRRLSLCIGVAVVAGCLAGVNVASDPLAAPVAIIPLLVVLAGVGWSALPADRSRIGAQAGVFFGSLLVSIGATRILGEATGVTADLPPGKLATINEIWASGLQSAENAMRFFGPAPFGAPLSPFGVLRLATGLIGLLGVILAIGYAVRIAKATYAHRTPLGGDPVQALWLYWGTSVVVGLAAVTSNPLSFEVRESSVRYELQLFLAAAVAVPIWLRRQPRSVHRGVAALVSVVALVGIVGLLTTRDDRRIGEHIPMVLQGPQAVTYAQRAGATRGYAGYWNAGPLRWKTGARVLPVANCGIDLGKTLCPTRFALPPHLLQPRSGAKSYLIIDHTYPGAPADEYLTGFGPWDERRVFGAVILLIYPYDIGTRFGRE